MEYVQTKPFSLKQSKSHDEKWLQELLAREPEILGLGNLEHIESERRQNNGGRLDLMFQDDAGDVRYCVELQLGATDEAHIIRTLEYWDNERSRNPHIDHIAVIVAEDVTTRFLNVISLFNKSVPLMAIQLNALEIGGNLAITGVKVLDLVQNMGWDDDNTSSKMITDRAYWEKKATPSTVKFADTFLGFIREVTKDETLELKFNKHYIGLAHQGIADNFVSFKPRKQAMIVEFKIPHSEELQSRIEETLDFVSFNSRWGLWLVRFTERDFKENQSFVKELVRLARQLPLETQSD